MDWQHVSKETFSCQEYWAMTMACFAHCGSCLQRQWLWWCYLFDRVISPIQPDPAHIYIYTAEVNIVKEIRKKKTYWAEKKHWIKWEICPLEFCQKLEMIDYLDSSSFFSAQNAYFFIYTILQFLCKIFPPVTQSRIHSHISYSLPGPVRANTKLPASAQTGASCIFER